MFGGLGVVGAVGVKVDIKKALVRALKILLHTDTTECPKTCNYFSGFIVKSQMLHETS